MSRNTDCGNGDIYDVGIKAEKTLESLQGFNVVVIMGSCFSWFYLLLYLVKSWLSPIVAPVEN